MATTSMTGDFLSRRPIRSILIHVAVVAVFGVFLPWWLGYQFLDPVTITAYGCLGVLFAAPAAAQAFSESRPRSMQEAVKLVAVSALYGEGMAIVILMAGFMTAYFRSRALLVVDLRALAGPIALGASGSLAMSAVAGVVGMLLPKDAARMALRIIFLALLALFFFRSRWLPDVEATGTLVCLGVAVIALAVLRVLIPASDAR
jgi:hypothetical protein